MAILSLEIQETHLSEIFQLEEETGQEGTDPSCGVHRCLGEKQHFSASAAAAESLAFLCCDDVPTEVRRANVDEAIRDGERNLPTIPVAEKLNFTFSLTPDSHLQVSYASNRGTVRDLYLIFLVVQFLPK